MFAIPGVKPLTTPVPAPIIATVVLVLLHEPLTDVSLKAMVVPMQRWGIPLIGPGKGYTVKGICDLTSG